MHEATATPAEDLRRRQLDLELESVTLGRIRYEAEQPLPWRTSATAKEESSTVPGKRVVEGALEPVAKAIEEFVEAANAGGAGRRHTAAKYLQGIDPTQAAYLALRAAVNGASGLAPLTAVAGNVASAIKDHADLLTLAGEKPGLYRKVMDQVSKATTARHRSGVLRHVQRKYNPKALTWSTQDCIALGTKLVELIADTTGIIELKKMTEGRHHTVFKVAFTEQAAAWFEAAHAKCALLQPLHLPMIAPPRPWRTPYSGGYLGDAIRLKLVKTRSRGHLDELGSVDMPMVYDAVNAVQATPWRINTRVLDVVEALQAQGGNVAGLPRRSDLPVPPLPHEIARDVDLRTLPLDMQEDFKVWKARAARVHEANALARSERVVVAQKLWIANKFREEAAIYFPHTLDFRGRIYPVASYVNPQGDDLGKGLLEFGEGKPLGEDGGFWLAVHLANLFGVDKVSFEERVAWVEANEERILASALEPLDEGFWMEADSPFCALAACFDWAGFKMSGSAHVSHLPIAMDGSCSGLQHFSAMLRDPVGGAQVNLVPSPKPADVYSRVAERAQVLSDSSAGEMTSVWKGKVCRKIAKQPTMTMCYSVTKLGVLKQIHSTLESLDRENGGRYLNGDVDNWTAAKFMADLVWQAIGETVVAARAAMDWLQLAAKVTSAAGIPIRWTTPAGLPILQEYREVEGDLVAVHWGGQRIRLTINKEGTALARRRQASGIAPNFVHSMDSAHLMRTTVLAVENNVTSFAMIHDSFGTHAADTSTLNAALRHAFVEQYRPDVLREFAEELREQLAAADPSAVLPDPPPLNSLDLEAVLDSDFFFA